MQVPEFVGLGELIAMFGISKSRLVQIIRERKFPDHYLQLQMGRLWRTDDVIAWAQETGRKFSLGVLEDLHLRTLSDRALSEGTGGPNSYTSATPVTISSGEEQKQVEVAEKTQSPSFASLTTSTVVPNPQEPDPNPQEPDEVPSRRTTQELNQLALAEDLDELERIYEAAKKGETLPESDMKLVAFSTMVIVSLGHVPNYRRTKGQMIRAWGEVRKAYSPTAEELVALAQHLMGAAQTPFTPGAVKKFSDFEIAKLRRTAAVKKARPTGWSRWQGAQGSEEHEIANLTPEERARYGVTERP